MPAQPKRRLPAGWGCSAKGACSIFAGQLQSSLQRRCACICTGSWGCYCRRPPSPRSRSWHPYLASLPRHPAPTANQPPVALPHSRQVRAPLNRSPHPSHRSPHVSLCLTTPPKLAAESSQQQRGGSRQLAYAPRDDCAPPSAGLTAATAGQPQGWRSHRAAVAAARLPTAVDGSEATICLRCCLLLR